MGCKNKNESMFVDMTISISYIVDLIKKIELHERSFPSENKESYYNNLGQLGSNLSKLCFYMSMYNKYDFSGSKTKRVRK